MHPLIRAFIILTAIYGLEATSARAGCLDGHAALDAAAPEAPAEIYALQIEPAWSDLSSNGGCERRCRYWYRHCFDNCADPSCQEWCRAEYRACLDACDSGTANHMLPDENVSASSRETIRSGAG